MGIGSSSSFQEALILVESRIWHGCAGIDQPCAQPFCGSVEKSCAVHEAKERQPGEWDFYNDYGCKNEEAFSATSHMCEQNLQDINMVEPESAPLWETIRWGKESRYLIWITISLDNL
jgi:hypothetical protein